MLIRSIILSLIFSCSFCCLHAQLSSHFLPNKPGQWIYDPNSENFAKTTDFHKNVTILAEWFHQNLPMLKNPVGYDMRVFPTSIWNEHYKLNSANYAVRCELNMQFQLFLANNANSGKWTVEPPHYNFEINNTEGGFHNRGSFPYFNNLQDDPAQEKAINAAAVKMNAIFSQFLYVKSLAPGVDMYTESADGDRCHVVVFNPKRPPYWKPVTVKEMADIYLEYYSLYQKTELDRMVLKQLKDEIAELSPDELAAEACMGHNSHFALPVNGRHQGLKLVRFNPEYWDRTLPPSAIQYITFWYPQYSANQMEEYFRNNGHPEYSQLLVNQIDWVKVAELIKCRDTK